MTETTHRKFSQLEELLSKLHDGVASDEEKKVIEDLLSGDPEACEFYLDYTESVSYTHLTLPTIYSV